MSEGMAPPESTRSRHLEGAAIGVGEHVCMNWLQEVATSLLPLASLTTNIKQFMRQLSDLERRFRGSCCLYATALDILVGGEVRG